MSAIDAGEGAAAGASAMPGSAVVATDASRIDLRLKVSWATGAFGVSVLMNGISALILFYLTMVVRLDPAVAGFLVFLSRVYDAVTDPLSGWLSDRTESRFGRRRPYLLAGAFVSAVAFLMVFTVPFAGPYESVWQGPGLLATGYVLFALLVYTTGYSLFNVPYMAMPAEMTDDYHERSSIHAWRVGFAAAGGLAVQALAGFVLEGLGKDWDAHAAVGAIGAGLIFTTMLIAFFGTRRAPAAPRSTQRVPWREQLLGFARNRPFQIVVGVKLAQLIGVSASSGGLVFLLATVMNRPLTLLPLIGVMTTLGVFVASPLLVRLSRLIGKRGGYMVSAAVTGVAALSWTLATPDEPASALALRGFLLGIAFAGNVLFAMSMLTDAMEVDRHATGLRREGMYSALYSFVEKLASSMGPLILGGALSIAGFDPKAQGLAPEEVRQAVLVGIAYVPAAMAVVAVTLLAFYRLDEAELQRLRAASAREARGG